MDCSNNRIGNLISSGAGGTVLGLTSSAATVTNTFSKDSIYNLSSTAASVTGMTVSGASTTNNIFKNNIYTLSSSLAGVASVIGLSSTGSATTNNIYNNFISDLKAPASNSNTSIYGMNATVGTTNNILFNTIYLGSSPSPITSSGAVFGGAGIGLTTTPTTNNVQNNIVNVNATKNGDTYFAALRFVATGTATSVPAGFTPKNNIYNCANIYGEGVTLSTATDVFGANGTGSNTVAFFNDETSTNSATCSIYKQLFTTDKDSYFEDILNTTSPTGAFVPSGSSYANNSAVATTLVVTDDFANATRGNPADRGALEFAGISPVACDGTTVAGTASAVSTAVCSNSSAVLSVTGQTTGKTGISYQWASSTTTGGPYTNISGATSANYTTAALTIPMYYVFMVTCGSCGTGTAYTSNEVAITINPLPTVAVSPTSAIFCSPSGTAVALTASGASTYTWSPATGLSASTGASVNATPAATTTYTVTGSDANGCKNTATTAINVSTTPSNLTATATPNTLCSGATSTLTGFGYVQNLAALANTYTFAGSTGTYTPITGTTLGSGAIGDDVGIGNLPIGFTFVYNGTNQTVFGARSNGLIELGNTTASISGFSANALASNANCIAPLWDDNNTTGGSIIYATTGTAPNRILTVQWTGMHVGGGGLSTNPTIDMQVKLYEANGAVQFIYGNTSAAFSSTTASIGISGAVGNYESLTPLSPASTSTISTSTENTTISSATNFPIGTTYTFTPPSLSTLTYSWTATTNLVSPSTAVTATNALSATETFNLVVNNGTCASAPVPVTVTVSSGAAITTQPVLATKCVGQTATFTVAATGASLTYIWYKDGIALANGGTISGANTATLTITGVVAGDAGVYSVQVSSACGSPVTSDLTSTLTVNALPTVVVSPTTSDYCIGGTAVALAASGSSTSYTWSPATGLNATTGATVNASPATTTTYTVTGTGANTCTSTATTVITPRAIPVAPTTTPYSVCVGATVPTGAGIATTAVGSGVLTGSQTLSFDVAAQPTEVNAAPGSIVATATLNPLPSGATVTSVVYTYNGINALSSSWQVDVHLGLSGAIVSAAVTGIGAGQNAGIFNFTNTVSSGITSTITGGPVNLLYWDNYSDNIGAEATFPTGTGVATVVVNYTYPNPASINWFTAATGGTSIGTGSPFNPIGADPALPNSSVAGNYTYYAEISNGSCPSTRTPVVFTISTGASITTQPVLATKCVGQTATFTVAATGPSLTYIWYKDGVALSNGGTISGATTATLTITGVVVADAGVYSVQVSSACGSPVTSDLTSTLTVNANPTVSTSPSGSAFICMPSGTVALTATSSASSPTYQWKLAGTNISGATSSTYSATAAGTYTVISSETATGCSTTSTALVISSSLKPSISATLTPSTVCVGNSATLTSTPTINQPGNYTVASLTPSAETPSGTPTVLATGGVATPTQGGSSLDDGYWDGISLPFSFNFYGTTYSTVRIATNGNVQFGTVTIASGNPGSSSWTPTTIPSTTANLYNFIAGPMIDQDVSTSPYGTIRYFVNGTAPNRKFVISYEACHVYNSSDANTSQIILNENNTIDVLLLGSGLNAPSTTKAIGLQDATGTLGTAAPGRNAGLWTTTADEAWRFTPPVPALTYLWSGPNSFSAAVQNPAAISPVTASAAGTYTVNITDPNGCIASATTTLTLKTAANSAALDATVGSITLPVGCTDGGWTYYTDPSDATKFVFGINWDPTSVGGTYNAAALAAATASLTLDNSTPTPFGVDDAATKGTWVMNRYWNVNLNGSTMDGPVNVRFFYLPSEKTATDAAATAFQAAHPTNSVKTPTWFKTVGSAYANDASHVSANNVLNNPIALTDVSAGTLNGITYAEFDGVTSFSGGSYASGVGPISSPLAITIAQLSGTLQGNSHILNWNVNIVGSTNVTMTLEASNDGQSFTAINTQTATAARCASPFNFANTQVVTGRNYYRLKVVDNNGKVSYSNIITLLANTKGFEMVNISPNPVVADAFKLNVTSTNAVKLQFVIADMQGRVVMTQNVNVIGGFTAIPVNVAKLSKGTYQIYGYTNDVKTKVISFVKQ